LEGVPAGSLTPGLTVLRYRGPGAPVERLLDETGLDVNEADDRGRTALHFAANAGHLNIGTAACY